MAAGQPFPAVERNGMSFRSALTLSAILGLVSLLPAAPALSAPAQAASSSSAPSSDIKATLDAILDEPVFRNAGVGVLVQSLSDGRTLYEHNPGLALIPASNNKILTSSTALMRLGLDYTYTTTLYRTGSLQPDGTLYGDLYLKGSGDPSFSSADLLAMAKKMHDSGVTRVSGRFLADATRFTDGPLGGGWAWDDEAADYQPQISALTCDENVIAISASPGAAPGAPVLVSLGGPQGAALGFTGTTYVSIRNTAITAEAGSEAGKEGVSFDRPRAQNVFTVTGAIPVGAKPTADALSVENPDLFTVTRMAEVLPLAGIATSNGGFQAVGRGAVPVSATVVAEKRSAPLSTLVRSFLKPSDNLYGELFLRTLGSEKAGRGTASGGVRVVSEFLREAGVDTGGWGMADGSGLSRKDTVTARLLVGVLTYMDQKAPAAVRDTFENALPIGGVDGTLRRRFLGTPAANNIHAKTGSLNRVSSLSGYVTTKAGEKLVFSILMNNYSGPIGNAHTAQDKIVLALIDTPKG